MAGEVGQGAVGPAGLGVAGHPWVRQARLGRVCRVPARQSWRGSARFCRARPGKAGVEWMGSDCSVALGVLRHGRHDNNSRVKALCVEATGL